MAERASRLPVDDAVLDGWLGEVVAKREEIAFRNLVFAGLGAGRPLCAKHLAEGTALFQDTDQLHRTAVRFTGNVGSALIAAVDTGRLEPDREAVAVAVAAMWCRERIEGQRIPGLMAAARRLGRRRRKSPATALALAIVCQVTEDPGLRSLMEGVSLPWVSGCELEFWRAAETGLWDCVPEEAGAVALSGHTVRRAVPRVGRNEPCPCGSGRKDKHCCLSKDQERLRQSSPVPGVTLEEWREQPELGVLVARGVLPLAPGLDGDTLLTQILEVRDRLGLAVEEPLEEAFYGLIDKNETAAEQDSEELANPAAPWN